MFSYIHSESESGFGLQKFSTYSVRSESESRFSLQKIFFELFRPRVNFGRKQEVNLQNFVPEGHPRGGTIQGGAVALACKTFLTGLAGLVYFYYWFPICPGPIIC